MNFYGYLWSTCGFITLWSFVQNIEKKIPYFIKYFFQQQGLRFGMPSHDICNVACRYSRFKEVLPELNQLWPIRITKTTVVIAYDAVSKIGRW